MNQKAQMIMSKKLDDFEISKIIIKHDFTTFALFVENFFDTAVYFIK